MLSDLAIRTAIKSSAPGARVISLRDVGERGAGRLSLLIRPAKGEPSSEWYVTWYREGERRTTKIGRYPAISLKEARALYRDSYLPEILEGRDPIGPRAFGRRSGLAVSDLFTAYVEYLRSKGKRSADDVHRILLGPNGAARDIGIGILAKDVEPRHMTPHLAAIRGRGSVGQANLVRCYLRAAFQFGLTAPNAYDGSAVGMDWGLKANPAALIRVDRDAFHARTRTLSRSEFAAFWWWLADAAVHNRMALAVQLMMLTGQRPDEVMQITTAAIDTESGFLSWPKTKNGRAHSIPLLGRTQEVLGSLAPNVHGLYFWRPGRPEVRAGVSAPRRLVHEYIGVTRCKPFTCHDLRRTWKTLAGDAQIHKDVRDLIQNHRHGDVSSRHYDHYDYAREKTQGMLTWDAYVSALLEGHPRRPCGPVYSFGGYTFDAGNGDFRSASTRLRLAPAETAVLAALLVAAGGEVDRESLIQTCYRAGERPTDRAVDLRVSRLRAALGPAGADMIKTCRGVGYRVAVPVEIRESE